MFYRVVFPRICVEQRDRHSWETRQYPGERH